MEYGENIHQMTAKFPKDEMYNPSSQIRRAADSIALNISEEEFKDHYEYAFNLMNMLSAFKKKIN